VTIVDVAFAETLSIMQPGDVGDVDLLASLLQRPAWMTEGACRSGKHPGVNFFPGRGESAAPAKEVCRRCPVRSPCLEFALEYDVSGVWGGTSERQRRQLLAGAPWSELSDDRRQAIMARALAPAKTKATAARTPCEHCGEPATGRYCNQRCRSAASYDRRRAAPCEFCGGETPKQFCDQACRTAAWERLRERAGLTAAEDAVKSRFG
jgi:WhiB family redox-sensing transcriptional regulator